MEKLIDNVGFAKITGKNITYFLQNLRQIVLEVTDKCNLNCTYCAYSDLYRGYDSREGKYLPFQKAKLIIDYLFNIWKENCTEGVNREFTYSFYGGEPLMNIELIKQVVNYVKELENVGRVYSFSMTTNAMLLDKYMDYLVDKNFRLLISLDGDEFAQSYRVDHAGKNSFERVFSNLKGLQEKYPEYFKNKIGFNSVLHNRNEVEFICRFIKSQFDKTPRIAALNNIGICEEKRDEFTRMFRNPIESILHSKNCEEIESELLMKAPRVARLADYILHQSGNSFFSYNDLYINKKKHDFPPTGTCLPFSKKMFVSVNGKILPCERIGQQFSLGQVYDDRVELDEEYIANQHNYYLSKYTKQCASCASNRFCMQCVYQIDDICNNNTRCLSYLTAKELEERNRNTFRFLQEHPYYYRRILEEVKYVV